MMTPTRITQIERISDRQMVAGTLGGTLHLLDEQLEIVSSPHRPDDGAPAAFKPIYAIAVAGKDVYCRDKAGKVLHYRLDEDGALRYVRETPAELLAPAEAAAEMDVCPTMIRGLHVTPTDIFVTNGFMELVVLDRDSLQFREQLELGDGFNPVEHAVVRDEAVMLTDRAGFLHMGSQVDLLTGKLDSVRLDSGACHEFVLSERRPVLYATGDENVGAERNVQNGLIEYDLVTGQIARYNFTSDDVESVCADLADPTRIYAGGFDARLLVFRDEADGLEFQHSIGPFPHQIIRVVAMAEGTVAVLCQDGSLMRVDGGSGQLIADIAYERQALWDRIEVDGGAEIFATDKGFATIDLRWQVADGEPDVREHDLGLGLTRRIVAFEDGVVGISWTNGVFLHDGTELVWDVQLDSRTIGLAVADDRIAVATDGGVVYLNRHGAIVGQRFSDTGSVWIICADDEGGLVFGTRTGDLRRLDRDGRLVWRSSVENYPKRMRLEDGVLNITGYAGLTQLSLATGETVKNYVGVLDNTIENYTAVADGYALISYGMQVCWYDGETAEPMAIYEELPDFPKVVWTVDDEAGLIGVAGRGGYVFLLRLNVAESTFELVESRLIPGAPASVPPRLSLPQPIEPTLDLVAS